MFGNNPSRQREHGVGEVLTVQGVPFLTIQGEGPHAGKPATFIRLWGCHLKCNFCDTDFESDPQLVHVSSLVQACETNNARLVVLTGGEPFRQNIKPLVQALQEKGFRVQIETAGSFWVKGLLELDGFAMLDLVVSPKTPTVHPRVREHAAAWKYIIAHDDGHDLEDGLPIVNWQGGDVTHRLARPPEYLQRSLIYVQPKDHGPEALTLNHWNTQRCIELCYKFGYTLSLQQHKIIGVP